MALVTPSQRLYAMPMLRAATHLTVPGVNMYNIAIKSLYVQPG